jgi:iron complex outermembrane receptor protein
MFEGNDNLLADAFGPGCYCQYQPRICGRPGTGLRHQSGKINLNLNFYYMSFKNEIVLNGQLGPNGLALTNEVDRSYRTGAELSINYKVNDYIHLINNSSYNYSRIKEQTQSFTPILTPPVIVNQEVTYSRKSYLIGLSARYQDRSFINFANSAQVNQYVTLNGRVQYDIKGFQFGIFVNNITNTKYFNDGYVDTDGTKKYFVQSPNKFLHLGKIYFLMHFFEIANTAFSILGYPISYVELIGTVFGLISVYFASRANILTWSTGIVNEVFLLSCFSRCICMPICFCRFTFL